MISQIFKITILVAISIFSFSNNSYAEKEKIAPEFQLAMRMIGHQTLLNSGDSSSRVLPIRKEGFRYEIPFESEFEFDPNELIMTIYQVLETLPNAVSYLVEVDNCITNETIYTYKVGGSESSTMMPCGGRTQPKDCYTIFITFLGNPVFDLESDYYESNEMYATNDGNNTATISLGIIAPLLLIGFFIFNRKKSKNISVETNANDNIISIGKYQYDTINMTLSVNDKTTELTGKEADLLLVLYKNANVTLEREQILKDVWGDEGDYIGRTLDVFISKLRKRLKADENVKIINVRGVGYRFVLDVT